uniref:RmlD-like substrate binding domain-containing protein n=1 Tax=Kalanchoe fedtschenkoi TaxID=63787 RepID=A0A7N0ZQT3_KALFE
MSKKKVLVIGGTGYLGQHLLQGLTASEDPPYYVAFTFASSLPAALIRAFPHALGFHVDLATGQGLEVIPETFGQPDVVVNCAALSVPRECEANPDRAMSVNVPHTLVKWLSSFEGEKPLLIHLSTDQVYEGVKSFYKEDDETVPVNVYGKSKVEAEKLISSSYSNYAILRSSIIVGPQCVARVAKTLPIQWIDEVLSKGQAEEFFEDEFRCPVYVKDVVSIILSLTKKWVSEGKPMQLLLNVGGPDRLSRAQMAEAVAQTRGHDLSLIKRVPASSVNRGVNSPADISMDITKLIQTVNVSPTSFRDSVKLTLQM